MATYTININGKDQKVETTESTPLLWVIREHLSYMGTKFGCESGTPLVACAIANAFFALTGKRMRHLPFTPERVLQVLS